MLAKVQAAGVEAAQLWDKVKPILRAGGDQTAVIMRPIGERKPLLVLTACAYITWRIIGADGILILLLLSIAMLVPFYHVSVLYARSASSS